MTKLGGASCLFVLGLLSLKGEPSLAQVGTESTKEVTNAYAVPADSRMPSEFAFVNTNVSCNKKGGKVRIKYASSVFSWCPLEQKRESIVGDGEVQLLESIQSTCGTDYEITYNFLDSYSSEERANKSREKELTNGNFTEHYNVAFSPAYYSTKCK